MVLSFRTAILLLVAIVIQSSLQNKTNRSVYNNKDESTSNFVERGLNNDYKNNDVDVSKNDDDDVSKINSKKSNNKKKLFNKNVDVSTNIKRKFYPSIVGGGNTIKCITRRERRIRRVYFSRKTFYIPYLVTVKDCNIF